MFDGCDHVRRFFFAKCNEFVRNNFAAFFENTGDAKKGKPPKFQFGWLVYILQISASGTFTIHGNGRTALDDVYQSELLEFLKVAQVYAAGQMT